MRLMWLPTQQGETFFQLSCKYILITVLSAYGSDFRPESKDTWSRVDVGFWIYTIFSYNPYEISYGHLSGMNQVQRSVDYYAVCNSAEQRLSTHTLDTLLGDPCGLWRGRPCNCPHLSLHE